MNCCQVPEMPFVKLCAYDEIFQLKFISTELKRQIAHTCCQDTIVVQPVIVECNENVNKHSACSWVLNLLKNVGKKSFKRKFL